MRLLRLIFMFYRDFIRHPEWRGENFTWRVPLRLAWREWRFISAPLDKEDA